MTTAVRGAEELHTTIAEEIVTSFVSMTRRKAAMLHQIAQFDNLDLAPQFGASTTARWLIQRLDLSETTAHEYVKVARALLLFVHLSAAFTEGEVNYSKVRLILPYLQRESENELVEMARSMGYHELEAALSRWRTGQGDDGERSYVRLSVRKSGRIRLWGDFSAAEGAQVMAAIKLGELAFHDVDMDALERDTEGCVTDRAINAAHHELEDREDVQQIRKSTSGFGPPLGKALLASFMGMVNVIRTAPRSTLRTPGAHVNIVMTTDGRAYLPGNLGAPSKEVANFLSNASYRVSTVDDKGLILNTGRAFRLATDAQINALLVMWRGKCAMPGCTHTRFLEMHHIQEWIDGGVTDLDNLLPLCSACHSLVSEGLVKITKDYGDVHFLMPDGVRFVSYDHGLPLRSDDALTMEEYLEASV